MQFTDAPFSDTHLWKGLLYGTYYAIRILRKEKKQGWPKSHGREYIDRFWNLCPRDVGRNNTCAADKQIGLIKRYVEKVGQLLTKVNGLILSPHVKGS